MYVSEEVKTLDLSLPSYDSINTLKSSAETERGLGVENPSLPEKTKLTSAKTTKNQNSGDDSNPLTAVLPSMRKSVAKKSKPKDDNETTARPEKVNKSVLGGQDDEIKTMDFSLPSYADSTKTKDKGLFAI
jgi:hypothetical protein